MSTRVMKCVLIAVCLVLAGCTTENTPPQKTTSQSAEPAKSTAPSASKETTGIGAAVSQPKSSQTSVEVAKTTPAVVEPPQETHKPDVIYVPTPPEVVAKMLELAQVTTDDVVYDLGCGDGRIVVAAAKMGCRAYGFDVDPQRIKESKENVETNGVGNLATIEQKDIFTLDLSPANVVTLYLLPSLNVKLIPQLEKLKPGSRIVSHDFDMKGVIPDKVVEVDGDGGYGHTVYLWTTPLKKKAETDQ